MTALEDYDELTIVLRVARSFSALAAALFLLVTACADDPMGNPSDAGVPVSQEDASTTFPDASLPPPQCECEDSAEDCLGCIEHIGTCCYDDSTIGGEAPNIAAACERSAACKSCCNECKLKSCDALKAAGECPNMGLN